MDISGLSKNSLELQNIIKSFISAKPTSEQLIKKLIKLRYPLTTDQDQKGKNFASKSAWPNPVQVTFKRHSDKSGFEVSAFVSTAKQCESVIPKFEQTFQSLNHYFESESSKELSKDAYHEL
jgi:hypothetical protein